MPELWRGWTELAWPLGRGLLCWSWQTGILLAATWLVTATVLRRQASRRSALWLAALVAVPLLPLVARAGWLPTAPLLRLAERPSEAARAVAPQGTGQEPGTVLLAPAVAQGPLPAAGRATPSLTARWPEAVAGAAVLAWMVGAAAMLARFALATAWTRRLCRRAQAIRDHALLDTVMEARSRLGITHPADLRTSDEVLTPATVGTIWPVVLLPPRILETGRYELIEKAVYHELAHVRRWDAAMTVYRRLLECALFFHPLVWLASCQYQVEQEYLCDDWAVRTLQDRTGYAQALGELAEFALGAPSAPALHFGHRPGVIRRRVARIVEGEQMPNPNLGLRGAIAVAVLSLVLLALAGSLPLAAPAAAQGPPPGPTAQAPRPAAVGQSPALAPRVLELKHDDGKTDGRQSLGASGHFVRFECPPGRWYLTTVQVMGSRYGAEAPPDDTFTITICDAHFRTLKSVRRPYSVFARRGEMRGYSIPVPPLELPSETREAQEPQPVPFWVNLAFNPSQTKGVYVAYDTSEAGSFSKLGLPDQQPEGIREGYDWMVRLVVTDTRPEPAPASLGAWAEPPRPLVPWQEAGLIELKNDDAESDGMQSIGAAGPAMHFENAPPGALLKRLRLCASRYGSGYDPDNTFCDYYVFDDDGRILQTGRIPYARFSYEAQWVEVPLEPVKTPPSFWVLINPNAHQYKGIYTHYDTDITACHSRYGRIPEELNELEQPWDWMIRAYVDPAKAAEAPP